MDRTKKLSDGTSVNVRMHGRPKGHRRVNLPNGFYYIEHEGAVYVYKTHDGSLETVLRSVEQAKQYAANRKAK